MSSPARGETFDDSKDALMGTTATAPLAEEEAIHQVKVLGGVGGGGGPPPEIVNVTSPAALNEGYTFDALHNGRRFSVTVPPGGVKEGQIFSVPVVPPSNTAETEVIPVAVAVAVPLSETSPMLASSSSPYQNRTAALPTVFQEEEDVPPTNAPLGFWNTGILDCCAEGCCHASLCNACWFPQILMGQVLYRMKLDWCGNPSTSGRRRQRQRYKWSAWMWFWLTIVYIIARIRLRECATDPASTSASSTLKNFSRQGGNFVQNQNQYQNFVSIENKINKAARKTRKFSHCYRDTTDLLQAVNVTWFIFAVFVLMKLRRAVRRAYRISQCLCEDLFCAVFCGCCTVAQLARQTADYNRHRAYCCTNTGLADDAMMMTDHRQRNVHQCPAHGGLVV